MKNLIVPYVGASLSDISQIFGVNPNEYQPNGHEGVDFAPKNAYGKFLLAPEISEVDQIITDDTFDNVYYPGLTRGYGIVMRSVEDHKITYLFWHCFQQFPVNVGQIVKQGQVVACMGNSGMCYSGGVYVPFADRPSGRGSHLHYEMRINGKKVDVLPYIDWTLPVSINVLQSIQQQIQAISNFITGKK